MQHLRRRILAVLPPYSAFRAASSVQGSSMECENPVAAEGEAEKAKKPRIFDWTMYNRRYIALHLAYMGEEYCGFAIQDPPKVTIESVLFEVLQKTRLVKDMKSCKYSRCGRTDKGVSAMGQVVSVQVRSNLLEGPGVIVPEDSRAHTRQGDTSTELPYTVMLNRNLPADIQVLGWTDVPQDFSARFSCKHRKYKYFFPRGNMDLEMVRTAAQSFVGQHDFRNFCKIDAGVTNFERTILKFDIETLDDGPSTPYQMCVATVVGLAFLMHQVRCMMSLLFLVGSGLEQPSVISHMLDLQRCPNKPQYGMAMPEPLVLYECCFEGLEWQREEKAGQKMVEHFQHLWTRQAVKSAMLYHMVGSLASRLTPDTHPTSQLAPLMASDHKLGARYKPVLKRPTSKSCEERHEIHLTKKRKTEGESGSSETHPEGVSRNR